MDGLTRPVGELPPEIYWRRRLVAGAFLVLAILVLYYLVRSLFGGGDGTATPNSSTSVSPGVTTSVSPGVTTSVSPGVTTSANATGDLTGIRLCGAADVTVILTATTHDWPGSTQPTFDAAVRHSATTQCVLDTSASDAELLVTSGSVRQWSNLDCDAAPVLAPEKLLLKTGGTATLQATWPRIRSADGCPSALAAPGSGTYRATLTVQGITSDQAVFALTD